MRKVARKRAKTQRYRYSASLLSIENRRKNNNLQSGFSRSFCYSLAKSKRFCTFDIAARRTKENAPAEGCGLHPFFDPHGSKNSLLFRSTKVASKNRREQRTEKIASRNFCLTIFANKMISAALKSSAKNGLRPSHESACDLSANRADKKERDHNSLPVLTRLLL